ncbi:hypothetical protein pdul_cds_484 [Pandoravirus dulcis]|uniref:Uncharacterized protein n=1 Tax=Pandoravirus dulcis TaxID=1349409 RepID=S4VQD8_9VIRU|nr:hypothetical protein pdul_cds_484 [Pandoravirus dulcis]AGO82563.1 hypothetical protein pdul_cds_484 [Pandoravirus dulcis]
MTTGPTNVTTTAGAAAPADTTTTATTVPVIGADAAQTRTALAETAVAPAVTAGGPTADAVPAIPTKPTLTIAGLCDVLRDLGDGEVDGASVITPLDLHINLSAGEHKQSYKSGLKTAIRSFTPDRLKGYNTISLSGTAVLAADLLKAVEPCLPAYADARVCVRLRRATTDRPRAVALSTDDLLFKDDPRTAAEAKTAADVVDFVKTMVEMRTIEPAKIAAAASALMPAGWSTTCYCVDGVLFNGWFELVARLPRLHPEDTTSLFTVFAGKSSDGGRGGFDLVASIPGITFAAFDEAFGPKKSGGGKIARLLAAAAAATSGSTSTPSL